MTLPRTASRTQSAHSTSNGSPTQRFTRGQTCPVCGGCEDDPRGQSKRCYGFISGDWCHCTRLEFSQNCTFHDESGTFSHWLKGPCRCGVIHDPTAYGATKTTVKKTIEHVYKYRDKDGQTVHETVRYRHENGEKTFSQRRPDGKGGHIWSLKGITTVLYNLPALLVADPDQPVWIPEGEKDVDKLGSLGRLATCNPMGAGKWWKHYADTLPRRICYIIPDNDKAGRDHAQKVAQSLHGVAASVKIVDLLQIMPGLPERGDVSDFLAAGGTIDQLDELAHETKEWEPAPVAASKPASQAKDQRPEILITTEEMEVNDQAISALASDRNLYRLGFVLATILEEGIPPRGVQYPDGPPPQIAPLESPSLRERMAAAAKWLAPKVRGGKIEIVPAHPPAWSVLAVHKRGIWPGIRPVVGVIESATIRRDGSIQNNPGYDQSTQLYLRPSVDCGNIPDEPLRQDAEDARDLLLDMVSEFPFKNEDHKAVWLAALLTVIGRPSFEGPSPLFAFDGNCPGSGKSKLADLIAVIASGRRMPRTIWPSGNNADEEMRKRITSLALAGERFTLLDNVDAPLGGGPLDAAMTSDTWKDRMLGSNTNTPALPMLMVWFASGNNVQFRGDFLRCGLLCRLESNLENPEERTGFKYSDLIGHALANRARLLRAALIILRGWHVAGCSTAVTPLGSFEPWTKAIVGPVEWITRRNPLDVRTDVKATDHGSQVRTALVEGWSDLPGSEAGLTVASALGILRDENNQKRFDTLRSALMELSDKGDYPSAKSIGRHLNSMKDRIVGKHVLRAVHLRVGIVAWKVTTP